MTQPLPMACTLNPEQLRQRLEQIAEVGTESFLSAEVSGRKHLLRFRNSGDARRRLERIVAAEAECCSFLKLSLDEGGTELILSIDAPARGEDMAQQLATAFATRQGGI